MARISKGYEERKTEIIQTGLTLFLRHGYDRTSVEMIIDTLEISKGSFYYYFKSKEELLDEIVEARVNAVADEIKLITQKKNSALKKLNLVFKKLVVFKTENKKLMKTLYEIWIDDSNAIIRQKMQNRNIKLVCPLIEEIIKQGMAEGSFHLPYSDGVAEMIIKSSIFITDSFIELCSKENDNTVLNQLIKLTDLYQLAIERILCIPEKSIKMYTRSQLRQLVEAMR